MRLFRVYLYIEQAQPDEGVTIEIGMIAQIIGIALAVIWVLIVLGILVLELQHHRRPGNSLRVSSGHWNLDIYEPQHYRLIGRMEFYNPVRNLEVMIPELQAEVRLLSGDSLAGITQQVTVTSQHPDAKPRRDGYWFAYIVKSHKHTQVEIAIDLQGQVSPLQAAWVQIHYVTYGPKGRLPRTHHEVVPLQFPAPDQPERWRPVPQGDVLSIATHLLTQLDEPVEIVDRYVLPHAQAGDVVTIGETPIAIMQGRWRHPTEIHPGWLARRLCYFFLPTSSLATACGLQALIDIVGPGRVLVAFLGGAIAKVFGHPGAFYQLAGEQARLIDDVTGTLPPYDQFIILGPDHPQRVVEQIQAKTGLSAAIVDVNDLKAVKILAATADVSLGFLESALRTNPAGNADEQTPVVLIRPTEPVRPTSAKP